MSKKLRSIVEKYPDDYEQKTEIGQSFVAIHKDSKIIDNLDPKLGSTETQFKADNVEVAPYKKAPQDGFPKDGQKNDFNLPTHYDSADNADKAEGDDDEYEFTFEDDEGDETPDAVKDRIKREEKTPRKSFKDVLAEAVSRKDFKQMANTIRSIEDPKKRQEHADLNADVYSKSNPRFDHAKFHAACGTQYKKAD